MFPTVCILFNLNVCLEGENKTFKRYNFRSSYFRTIKTNKHTEVRFLKEKQHLKCLMVPVATSLIQDYKSFQYFDMTFAMVVLELSSKIFSRGS